MPALPRSARRRGIAVGAYCHLGTASSIASSRRFSSLPFG